MVRLALSAIHSPWGKDLAALVKTDHRAVSSAPVLVTPCCDGPFGRFHYIVDGHHRVYQAAQRGESDVLAVVLPCRFEDTQPLRRFDVWLKSRSLWTISERYKHFLAEAFDAQ